MPRAPRVLIAGAGLTGCTLAHRLPPHGIAGGLLEAAGGPPRPAQHGIASVLLERAAVPGGLIRSAHLEGVLYEPHGSHIFHTEDEEIWKLANAMTPFRPYRHRVDIVIEDQVLNWPILLSDIDRQSRGADIREELRERRDVDPAARAD